MTVRDELVRVLAMGKNVPTTESVQAYLEATTIFLRDHGTALVEAVRDAERWREVRDNARGWFHPILAAAPSMVDWKSPKGIERMVDEAIEAKSKAIDQARAEGGE